MEVSPMGVIIALGTHIVAFIIWATRLHVRSTDHEARIDRLEKSHIVDHEAMAVVRESLATINAKLDFLKEQGRRNVENGAIFSGRG